MTIDQASGTRPLPTGMESMWERAKELRPENPGAVHHAVIGTALLDGRMDDEAFTQAVHDVISHHVALRLQFATTSLDPEVSIRQPAKVELHKVDIADLDSSAQRQYYATRILKVEQDREYDLKRDRLWTIHLVKLASEKHLLILARFHLLMDGWSNRIVLEDLIHSYRYRRGIAHPPQWASQDLFDMSADQDAGKLDDSSLRQLAEQVMRRDDLFPVPTGKPRSGDYLISNRAVAFALDGGTRKALDRTAWANRCTPYIVFLAAYRLLLSLSCPGQTPIIGSSALRSKVNSHRRVVGPFNRELFIVTDLDRRMSLKQCTVAARSAVDHAIRCTTGYKRLAKAVNPNFDAERPWSDLNIFNAYIQSEPPLVGDLVYPDIRMSEGLPPAWRAVTSANFRLRVSDVGPETIPAWIKHTAPNVQIDDNRSGGHIFYNATFFRPASVHLLAETYVRLVAAFAREPDLRICDLRLTSNILTEGNA